MEKNEKILKVKDLKTLEEFYNGSVYTIIGAGGDLMEFFNGYNELLADAKIGQVKQMYAFEGNLMNDFLRLKGKNDDFSKNLTFLVFKLDNLDIGKLSIFKIKMGDRWFDDVVDNSKNI